MYVYMSIPEFKKLYIYIHRAILALGAQTPHLLVCVHSCVLVFCYLVATLQCTTPTMPGRVPHAIWNRVPPTMLAPPDCIIHAEIIYIQAHVYVSRRARLCMRHCHTSPTEHACGHNRFPQQCVQVRTVAAFSAHGLAGARSLGVGPRSFFRRRKKVRCRTSPAREVPAVPDRGNFLLAGGLTKRGGTLIGTRRPIGWPCTCTGVLGAGRSSGSADPSSISTCRGHFWSPKKLCCWR